jgi:GNAT superfamily N-acetyltransferase
MLDICVAHGFNTTIGETVIEYVTALDGIAADMLSGFFVGWPNPPSPETHLAILRNSAFAVLAIDREAEHVVGFITAISDGVLSAYIPLLEVLPDYQGQGIGTELVKCMLAQCAGLYMVDTTCDPDVQRFYERCGMRASTGAMLRNYARQAGKGVNRK